MRPIVPMLLLAGFTAASAARADTFTFTSTTNPALGNFQFALPSTPIPSYVGPYGLYIDTDVVPVTAGGTSFLSATHWFADGFSFDSGDYYLHDASPFTGSLDAPTFLPGSYAMTEYYPGGVGEGTLVISGAVTPEPSTLVLLATGLLGAAGFRRRRD